MIRNTFSSRAVLATTLCGLLAATLEAQNIGGQTGQIRGKVSDSTGAALPGVVVTATSPALPGISSVTSDATGEFRFPALPFGLYRVQASLSGFAAAAAEGLNLKIGETLRVSLKLSPGLSEKIDVEAAGAVIDVSTSSKDANISSETIMELPRDRSFESIAFILPGVNSETQAGGTGTGDVGTERSLSIQGASASENVFVVDGIETGNTQQGLQGQDVVFEFVEEIQVKSGGFAAEFGGALGGLINVATKSGSNVFRGGVTFQYAGDKLAATPRPSLALTSDNRGFRYIPQSDDKFTQYDYGLYLGGPIKKDRLWFFAGYVPQKTSTDRTIQFTQGGSQVFSETINRGFTMAKLTLRATDSLKLNLAFNRAPYSDEGSLPAPGSLPSKPTFDYSTLLGENGAKSGSLTADWTPTPKLLVNAFAGLYFLDGAEAVAQSTRVSFSTSNLVFPELPTNLLAPANFTNVPNNLGDVPRTQRRPSVGVSATSFFKGGGDHALKFGAQYASPQTDVNRGYVGGRFFMSWDQSDAGVRGRYGFYRSFELSVNGLIDSSNLALFVQDQWQVTNRLTLNLGIRTEQEEVSTDSPLFASSPKIEFGFGQKLAPRVGFAYDVKGDSSVKLYASTGFFYDTLKHNLARIALAGTNFTQDFYRIDNPDWTKLSSSNPGALGTLIRRLVSIAPVQSPIDPDLKPTRTFEITGGAAIQLSSNTAVEARYTHKALQNYIHVLHLDPTGLGAGINTIVNPGQGLAEYPYGARYPKMPEFERNYDGLELSITRRQAANWMGSLNYTLSRLRGNTDGLANAEGAGGDLLPNAGEACSYLEGCYTDSGKPDVGPLSVDRPHNFKAFGSYRFSFGLTAGAFFQMQSGVPYDALGEVITAPSVRVLLLHIGGRGAPGRTPTLNQTNLFLDYGVKLGGERRLSLFANLLNAFDQDKGTDFSQSRYLAGIQVPRASFFQGFNYASIAAAQNQREDPRFGQPVRFQAPRKLRLGLRLTF